MVWIIDEVRVGTRFKFSMSNSGVLYFEIRLSVLNVRDLWMEAMNEAYTYTFSIHPEGTKIYQDVGGSFWWGNMKKEIAEFVAHCLTCQQVRQSINDLHAYVRHSLFPSVSGISLPSIS